MTIDNRKLISIVTLYYNEEGNAEALSRAVQAVLDTLPEYRYELTFVDNSSRDGTRSILRRLRSEDPRIKAIFNPSNFGTIRSGIHVLGQSRGGAVIGLACDFQDPQEMISTLLEHWKEGCLVVVLGVKASVEERGLRRWARDNYYAIRTSIADALVVPQSTGFGLFDRSVEDIRRIGDPHPFIRGMLAEIDYPPKVVPNHKPLRRSGRSSYNLVSCLDQPLVGIAAHSRVP